MRNKITGIIDEGEDNVYDNIETEGFDIGFLNKGKNNTITNSRFYIAKTISWAHSWWWQILSGLIVVVLGGYFLYLLAWS